MNEMRTIEDLAEVVPSERGMLHPEEFWGDLGSVWVAGVTRGGHCLG